MAVTITNIGTPSSQSIFQNTAANNVVNSIKPSSAVAYSIKIDNSANLGAPVYVKFYNMASGSVIVGTTDPDHIVYVPAGAVVTHDFFTGASSGITFGTALSMAAVTTGGTGGTTSPANPVVVAMTFV